MHNSQVGIVIVQALFMSLTLSSCMQLKGRKWEEVVEMVVDKN